MKHVLLVGSAFEGVDCGMDDFCDFVDKYEYFLLQSLCDVRKTSDIAKSKDGEDLLTWDHGIDSAILFHVGTDDLCPSFPEPDGKECSGFDNKSFEDNSLESLFLKLVLPETVFQLVLSKLLFG
jgi:hypothetical protein